MKKIAIFAMSFSAISYAQQPKTHDIEKDTLGLEENRCGGQCNDY